MDNGHLRQTLFLIPMGIGTGSFTVASSARDFHTIPFYFSGTAGKPDTCLTKETKNVLPNVRRKSTIAKEGAPFIYFDCFQNL
jgi:hypothetical protein